MQECVTAAVIGKFLEQFPLHVAKTKNAENKMTNALIFIRPLEASNVDSTKGDWEERSEGITVWQGFFFEIVR